MAAHEDRVKAIERLRVCMVCGYRPTPSGGGTEKHVCELTNGLLARGVQVDIVCEDRSFLPDKANPLADHIVGVPPDSLHERGAVEHFQEKSRRFCEMIDSARYDLVHFHGQYGFHTALRWTQLARRPLLVSTFHLTALGPVERYRQLGLPEPEEAPVDRAAALMEEATGYLSDRCIAVSRGVAREITELYSVPSARVEVIYNWYDPSIFRPFDRDVARRRLQLAADDRYLLYVGHFRMSRGRILAKVLQLLPRDVTLLVVHHEEDEAIVAEFGSRVQFTGHVQPQAMALYYSAADLLCFPTLYGGFGLVLVEAMACGCPPVVFDYPAMNELVTEESGYLVAEPTPAAYAATIERALRDGRKKAAAARARARAFNMETQIDSVLALYQELLWRGSRSVYSA
jgi:glycosyltransferase involved in cell wall biosynthesis